MGSTLLLRDCRPTELPIQIRRLIIQSRRRDHLPMFYLMWGVIAAISVYDAVLVYLYRGVILDHEQNPIGLMLIKMHQGDVWVFVILKIALTSLVIAILAILYERLRRLAMPITTGVTAFQVGLLGYLSIG